MTRSFTGTWHWDDVRASLDSVIASLPESPFLWRLEKADSKHHDSSVVYSWGVALAVLHGLERPWEYGEALTDSAAIHRPSLETRERKAGGESVGWSSLEAADRWGDFVIKLRSANGLPIEPEDGI